MTIYSEPTGYAVKLKLDNVLKIPDKVSYTEYTLKKCKEVIITVIIIMTLTLPSLVDSWLRKVRVQEEGI